MNSEGGPAILTQIFGDIVGDTFGGDEYQNFSVLIADEVEVFQQFASFLKVRADLDDLGDVVVCRQFHGANIHLDEVVQEIL